MRHSPRLIRTVVAAWLLSSLASITFAHETQPAVMDVTLGGEVSIELSLNAEAVLAGIDLSIYGDTNEAPEAAAYDALRALPDAALADAVASEFDLISRLLLTRGLGPLALRDVAVTPEPDGELMRQTRLVIEAPVTGPVQIGPALPFGQLILRQTEESGFAGLLGPGVLSPELEAESGGFWSWVRGLFGG